MKATPESLRARCNTALQSLPDAQYKTMLAALFDDLLAGRIAAQSAPTEIHADTPRHELLPRLRRLASDFQSHPLSRSISECEEAGIAMAEAAKQIEMLCRTRNTVVNHSGRMRKEIAALTEHRDFLLRELAKIDGDPGNACHYAIEAISAVCADLAEPVPPLPEGVKARFKCEDCDGTGYTGEMIPGSEFQPPEPVGCTSCNFTGWWAECEAFSVDQMRAYVDADRAAAQVDQPSMPSSEWLAEALALEEDAAAKANDLMVEPNDSLRITRLAATASMARHRLRAHLSKRVTADTVRMLTPDEIFQALLAELQQPGGVKRTPNQIVQHAFCRVNRGRFIPDGEVRNAV